ncbi:hypothetical protein SCMU_10590 [Sinomonas cyclohexanicum]|uniref:Uncharacterized protein n=1 Tax=Sinomonas cyclohexanicum TaxID=322009 RepID=A0ABM7PSK6_SINCY|nr:hypothetical protein [Corynebacterium cyclohexanicum]BCT75217.1 hypothetical protein SCMU_10590 [Corynebacterium cyclohexanicum]
MDLPVRRGLGHAYAASAVAVVGVVLASALGMAGVTLGLARRSLVALLLWPGAPTPARSAASWPRSGCWPTPGLLLVSALGGVVFAAAAALDNAAGGLATEWTVIIIHLVISAASLAVLVWYLAAVPSARRRVAGAREPGTRRRASGRVPRGA